MIEKITHSEKVGEGEYKLFTESNHAYYYKILHTDKTRSNFEKEDENWRNMVREGEQILMEWIENPVGESPATIGWNYEGMALFEVKLRNEYFPGRKYFGSEINPYKWKDADGWIVDEAWPDASKPPKRCPWGCAYPATQKDYAPSSEAPGAV